MTGNHTTGRVWPTAALWDAGLRLGHTLTLPPLPLRPAAAGMRLSGPLRRVPHTHGVASILDALDASAPGDVLLIDNQGRTDEACVGDLVAIEARLAKIAGILVWGCHRDSDDLAVIGLPVFSLGPCPASPTPRPAPTDTGPGARGAAGTGGAGTGAAGGGSGQAFKAVDGDIAVADSDGLVLIPAAAHHDILDTARTIVQAEQHQANQALGGISLREQLRWHDYQEQRRTDPTYTFRAHLTRINGALE
ncbi:RraA family protein [Streptomyces sp. NPDC058662]|uniref:RraA family protein n=1 Tax=Streptomyces sp. NPDC058662 TaxID=3346583 RepID=UPI0036649BC2